MAAIERIFAAPKRVPDIGDCGATAEGAVTGVVVLFGVAESIRGLKQNKQEMKKGKTCDALEIHEDD